MGAILEIGTPNLILSSRKANPAWSIAASNNQMFVSITRAKTSRCSATRVRSARITDLIASTGIARTKTGKPPRIDPRLLAFGHHPYDSRPTLRHQRTSIAGPFIRLRFAHHRCAPLFADAIAQPNNWSAGLNPVRFAAGQYNDLQALRRTADSQEHAFEPPWVRVHERVVQNDRCFHAALSKQIGECEAR